MKSKNIILLLFVLLSASCPSDKSLPNAGLCADANEFAHCTDEALHATGGYFKLKCIESNVKQVCSKDDVQVLLKRFSCLRENKYCAACRMFQDSAKNNKSRISVDDYLAAARILKKCATTKLSESCENQFSEDTYNPFDLPNNNLSLSVGLIRTAPKVSGVHLGGTKGNAICEKIAKTEFVKCANFLVPIAQAEYSENCAARLIDESCTPLEEENILAALDCTQTSNFCEAARDYLSVKENPVQASQSRGKAMLIIEKCWPKITTLCEMSLKKEVSSPLDIQKNE